MSLSGTGGVTDGSGGIDTEMIGIIVGVVVAVLIIIAVIIIVILLLYKKGSDTIHNGLKLHNSNNDVTYHNDTPHCETMSEYNAVNMPATGNAHLL